MPILSWRKGRLERGGVVCGLSYPEEGVRVFPSVAVCWLHSDAL